MVWIISLGTTPVEINRTVEEDRRIGEQLLSMREQVEELHIHLASFAHGVMDKAPDIEERRQRLQDTLIVQDAAASTIVGDRDGPATLAATAYRASLRNMKTEVEGVTDFMSLADFWKAASDLLVARNEFLRELSNYRHSADS